jgi:hypothetical protein
MEVPSLGSAGASMPSRPCRVTYCAFLGLRCQPHSAGDTALTHLPQSLMITSAFSALDASKLVEYPSEAVKIRSAITLS